ncbi:DUF5988 family protein [Streptomyces luteireticuli]|uniref:Uncharacterized protein n=1 Tax=Streptomyces luteireticuli TaxID=173858 RepID=A0ABN0YZS4_9ACTN
MSGHEFPDGDGQLVVLEGGPPGMPSPYRVPGGAGGDGARLTVAYYGQHQHFERSGTRHVGGLALPVFRWSYSTAIAE